MRTYEQIMPPEMLTPAELARALTHYTKLAKDSEYLLHSPECVCRQCMQAEELDQLRREEDHV